jgi:enoyl-CoA hydratase
MPESITWTIADGLAVVTLDDGKVNAMSRPWFEALGAVLDRVEQSDAKAVVITGRPGMFSAGLNLKVLPTLPPEELRATLLAFGRTFLRVFTFPRPTIAEIPGHAIAGGAMLAFGCDLRVMAEGPYRIHLNEVAIGLVLPTWAILFAQSAIPTRWHTEAILHARPYAPDEALERGIVDRVARPADRLLDEARALAAPLAGLDLTAYAGSKARHRAQAVAWAEARLERELPER